jgi:hypothetical protein
LKPYSHVPVHVHACVHCSMSTFLTVCMRVWRSVHLFVCPSNLSICIYVRVRRAGEGLTSKCTGNASTSRSSNPSTSTSIGLNGASAAPTDNSQRRLASTCFLQRPSTSTSIAVNAASAAPTDNSPAPDAANPETQSPGQWFRSRTVPKKGLMGLSRCCVAAPGTNSE